MEFLDLIVQFLMQNPVALKVMTVLVILRAINKPLFSLLRSYVDATPSKADNEMLDKILASKAYQVVSYILDYVASVKMPQKKVEPEVKSEEQKAA